MRLNNKTFLSTVIIICCSSLLVTTFSCKKESKTSADTPTTQILDSKQQANLPKLIDLGAGKCIPCKMMIPILEELKTEYAGKLVVEVIDITEKPEKSQEYGIEIIPTQIFYDPDGKEFQRHEGFISKEDIISAFTEKGIKLN